MLPSIFSSKFGFCFTYIFDSSNNIDFTITLIIEYIIFFLYFMFIVVKYLKFYIKQKTQVKPDVVCVC